MRAQNSLPAIALLLASCVWSQAVALSVARKAIRQRDFTFEANRGQVDLNYLFLARAGRRGIGFSHDGVSIGLGGSKEGVQLQFVGSEPSSGPRGVEKTAARSHYFRGRTPEEWHTGVPHFRRLVYRDIYPGVDAWFYSRDGELEYDLTLEPFGDLSQVEMRVEGADLLELDEDGNLLIRQGDRVLVQSPPVVLQEGRTGVPGTFEIRGRQSYGFRIPDRNLEQKLTVDPVIRLSTYLGGSASESIRSVALDSDGNIFVVGDTYSDDFPTLDPVQSEKRDRPGFYSSDVFIAKYSPGGGELLFATYLGGDREEYGWELAVGPDGTPYVAGTTKSADFPLVKPIQSDINQGPVVGSRDGFITRLSSDGSRILFSSYLGGSSDDNIEGIQVDPSGNIYLAGYTRSADFPTSNALKAGLDGDYDGFATKLAPGGSSVRFSTYYGGSGLDLFLALSLDGSGNLCLGGLTESTDFPVSGAAQPASGGGRDGTVVKISSSGGQVLFSTYLGGGSQDEIRGIDRGPDGSIYLTGFTGSDDFPVTAGATVFDREGYENAFLSRLSSSGNQLLYSTYLGGGGQTWAFAVRVGDDGQAYLAGFTNSNDFPTVSPLKAAKAPGTSDGFIAVFSSDDPPSVLFSSSFGGDTGDPSSSSEDISDLDVDGAGNIYLVGRTNSTDFPVRDAVQATYGGTDDGFLTILEPTRVALSVGTASAPPGSTAIVPVRIEGGDGVSAFRFTLAFNPDLLSVPASRVVSAGDLAGNHTLSYSIEANRITVAGFSSGLDTLSGSEGVLANVTLRLDGGVPVGTAVAFNLVGADVSDAAGNSLVPGLSGGSVIASESLPPPSAGQNEIVFPQVANGQFAGGSFVTTLVFVNRSEADAVGEIEFFRSDGSPFALTLTDSRTGSSFDLEIPAAGALFLQTDGLGELASGYAPVSSTVPLGGTLIFTAVKPDGSSSSETAVGVSPVGKAFTLPLLVGGGSNTGIALANVSSAGAEVSLTLLDPDGETLETTVQDLSAGRHQALFATELFDSLTGQADFEGRIEVTSPTPIAVVALKQEGILLTTFPVLEPK